MCYNVQGLRVDVVRICIASTPLSLSVSCIWISFSVFVFIDGACSKLNYYSSTFYFYDYVTRSILKLLCRLGSFLVFKRTCSRMDSSICECCCCDPTLMTTPENLPCLPCFLSSSSTPIIIRSFCFGVAFFCLANFSLTFVYFPPCTLFLRGLLTQCGRLTAAQPCNSFATETFQYWMVDVDSHARKFSMVFFRRRRSW